jgi:hypothetical protein
VSEYDDAYIIERCNGVCFEAIEIIHDLRAQLAALQSQPRLQPVTPEAMAELEGRGAWAILFRHRESRWNRYAGATCFPRERCWFGSDGNKIDPLDFCWYIVPDAIPEVQQ